MELLRGQSQRRCKLSVAIPVAAFCLGGLLLQAWWQTAPTSQWLKVLDFAPVQTSHSKGTQHSAASDRCPTQRMRACPLRDGSGAGIDGNWTFEVLLSLQQACQVRPTPGSEPQRHLLLPLVPVGPNMKQGRADVRSTWGAGLEHLTFLVQLRRDGSPIPADLAREAAKFGDIFIVRGPIDDSYDCLTLKLLAFLRWYDRQCSDGFHYLLKTDHDSYWHVDSLRWLLNQRLLAAKNCSTKHRTTRSLRKPTLGNRNSRSTPAAPTGPTKPQSNRSTQTSTLLSSPSLARTPPKSAPASPAPAEILGAMQVRARVRRHPASKFCVPPEAYPADVYPTYASGGPGYVLSHRAVGLLVEAATHVTPFWLEDVYITGMLAEGAARPVARLNLPGVFYQPHARLDRAESALSLPPLGVHGLSSADMLRLQGWAASGATAQRWVAKLRPALGSSVNRRQVCDSGGGVS